MSNLVAVLRFLFCVCTLSFCLWFWWDEWQRHRTKRELQRQQKAYRCGMLVASKYTLYTGKLPSSEFMYYVREIGYCNDPTQDAIRELIHQTDSIFAAGWTHQPELISLDN